MTIADKDEIVDQLQGSSSESSNDQDDLEPSIWGASSNSDLTTVPERTDDRDDLNALPKNAITGHELVEAPTPPQADLGLEEIVREHLQELWGRGLRAEGDYVPSTYAKLESADLETRRRGEFELAILVQFDYRRADDPSYSLLWESSLDGWFSCFEEYGGPPLEEFGQLTREQQVALEEELGLVGERMEQVQAECWSRARIYEGKDEETDRLLLLQHQYYLDVAQDWVEENPDSVVPVVQDADAQENG